MVRRCYERDFRRALLQADRRLRLLRFSRKPRRRLRATGRRLGLSECRYPAVFGGALLNPQPMGFYRRRRSCAMAGAWGRNRPACGRGAQRLGLHAGTGPCSLPASGGKRSAGERSRGASRLPPHCRACRRRIAKAHRGARQRLFLDRAARRDRRRFALHHRAAGGSRCVPLAGTRPARRFMGGAPARHDRHSPAARRRQARCAAGFGAAAADAAFERRAFPGASRRAPRHAALRACRGRLRGDRTVAESASGAVFPRPPHRARRRSRNAELRSDAVTQDSSSPSPASFWCGSGRAPRRASCS